MAYIRSRTFCCCIPVRFGVFILSLVGVIGSILCCAAGWVQVTRLRNNPVPPPTADVVAIWLHSSLFTLLAILSLFGFIGCLIKSRNSVRAYSFGLILFLGLSIASGAYALHTLFTSDPLVVINSCINTPGANLTWDACKANIKVYKGISVTLYILMWLLMIYAYVIVDNYVEQLDDEMAATETRQMINAISQPQVNVAVPTYASFGNPPNTANGYTFAHHNQSYGHRGNGSIA
ncbi:hypothetical protein Hypma_005290 [Hypsizygus marmoreus]|uniref:MARVEL domain-containing protein n=1 Tax=Hypsizygus marmoreus TaxID=39966 RepID=A0A369K4R7_HYPMA|nr:hypothetical protein Hypma_005290 [Hypsizygus marmoreus]